MMKEHPILFSGEMVQAILKGQKTETRRPIKCQKAANCDHLIYRFSPNGKRPVYTTDPSQIRTPDSCCPYGQVGDRLWVRETFAKAGVMQSTGLGEETIYRADSSDFSQYEFWDERWTPSIYMPRWASRILLEITEIKIEQLQEITAESCINEGIPKPHVEDGEYPEGFSSWSESDQEDWYNKTARADFFAASIRTEEILNSFKSLWDSINAERGVPWFSNPWVWVIKFKRIVGDGSQEL